ncbi:MAG: signal peptidase I [Candidatus Andersenbacteria bacterium]|nr:signal peptidase I [Candidatus Andersenbacteria bacterium]
MDEESFENRSFVWVVGSFFWELLKAFLLAMVIIVPIRYFIAQPFFVRGASMEPNFHNGEYLVIDQLSYRLSQPKRDDVIVFRYPLDESQFFIKRIIGLPGDEVIIDNSQIEIKNTSYPNGVLLNESQYLSSDVTTGGQVDVRLGSDEYFVLGDNRPSSSDSRVWGLVKRSEIVGRVWVRAWPFDRLTTFHSLVPSFVSPQS